MKNIRKWDFRFLNLAKHVSSWSKDPSTKVGAVIVDDKNRIVSIGYNGFPVNISDDYRLLDRETKLEHIVHAEINAILFANKPLTDCTLYTYPLFPCNRCCAQILQTGIARIVSVHCKHDHWKINVDLSQDMFIEAGVHYTLYDEDWLNENNF